MATATPTEQTQITSTIPKYAEPYAQQLLGSVFGGVDPTTGQFVPGLTGQGYEPYRGQTVAGFNPLQQQAIESVAGMRTAPQLRTASGLAALAGLRAREATQYAPAAPTATYQAPQFRSLATTYRDVTAPQLERLRMETVRDVMAPQLREYQMGPAERIGAERFGLGAAREYMSPYMQEVLERQKRGAVSDYMRQLPGIGAASARMGARGGTREALLQSEARRSLSERLGDIEATGLQQAYQQAMQQYNVDQQQRMQAALANQAAGMNVVQQNLAAMLGIQQLGSGQALQSALANQAAQQAAAQANLQSALQTQGLGAQVGMQAQQLNQAAQLQAQQQALAQEAAANQFSLQNAAQRAQAEQAAAQLAEQSRQYGAGLGLQGLQQELAAAGTLGGLGQTQYGQQMGITSAQIGAGGQMQAMEQQLLNQQLQDFINKQQLPYKQAEFGMGILRGIPATGQTSTLYQQPGSLFGQIAGVGLGLGSLFGGLGSKSS